MLINLLRLLPFLLLYTKSSSTSNDWDLLIFTQHWPLTVCLHYEESVMGLSGKHYCTLPANKDAWTIHGVWPTKLNTEGPAFCNTSIKFDADVLEPIKPELTTQWPNIEGGKTMCSLWRHEWLKHGTCAISLPALNTETRYFQTGLDWFLRFNASRILREHHIIPGADPVFHVQEIYESVKMAVGKNPHIVCVKEVKTQQPYLFEIRICMTKTLEPTDCDGTLGYPSTPILTNCPLNTPLFYPSQVPPANPPRLPAHPYPSVDWQTHSEGRLLLTALRTLRFLQWLTL